MIQIKPYKSSEALNKVPKCPSRMAKGHEWNYPIDN